MKQENKNLPALTKESTPEEIESHFRRVFELAQSGEEFPANLDNDWQLSYETKGHAVRALRQDFIEGVDYKVFTILGKNPQGGRPTEEYRLSVACLEFFVARKRREVFEIYRKVFHATFQMAQQQAAQQSAPQPKSKKQSDSLIKSPSAKEVRAACAMVNETCKQMGYSKVSRMRMLNKVADYYGLPMHEDYTDFEGPIMAHTQLLKMHNIKLDPKAFNPLLETFGLTEKMPYNTREGIKYYYHLTPEGEKYGKNDDYTDHPGKAQIHYFIKKFPALLDRVNLKSDPTLVAQSKVKALPQPEQPSLFDNVNI